jgi:hypothetical protein
MKIEMDFQNVLESSHVLQFYPSQYGGVIV